MYKRQAHQIAHIEGVVRQLRQVCFGDIDIALFQRFGRVAVIYTLELEDDDIFLIAYALDLVRRESLFVLYEDLFEFFISFLAI